MSSRAVDLLGKVFGRLTVIGPAENKGKTACWLCRCSCPRQATKVVRGDVLRCGGTKSCGCLMVGRAPTHGCARVNAPAPEYVSWRAMKRRCTSRKAANYAEYGGRGIIVCDRWMNSFESFLADIGPRPVGTTLDRIDVNGHYEPGNCRWSSVTSQNRNRRTVKLSQNKVREIRALAADGIRTQKDIGREFGIAPSTVGDILRNKIWQEAA